ncbi:MAG: caspase family protein [Spirochaetales bacterium]|nr:caspase family protein [Spirochaetales bacterium]
MTKIKDKLKSIGIQFGVIFFVAIMLLLSAAKASAADSVMQRYALYIGSNYGGNERQTLSYAVSDAQTVFDVMQQLGGVAPADSVLLSDPTPAMVNRTIRKIKSNLDDTDSKRTEFFFYYSGHSDEHGLLLGDSVYKYDKLKEALKSVGADVSIAVLDSCSSGTFTRMKGGVRRSPFLSDDSVDASGHAFLTSSSEDEAAQESDDLGASFFTHYFVSALRGAGDSTMDGLVSLNEAYSYASSETLASTEDTLAGPQHPSYDIQLAGTGDLVLTDLRSISEQIVFEKNLHGHIFVRDKDGRLVVELNKKKGSPLSVSMNPGRYSITLDDGAELLTSSIVLSNGSKAYVVRDEFKYAERESYRTRGVKDHSPAEDALKVREEYADKDSGFRIGFFPVTHSLSGVQVGLGSINRGSLDGAQLSFLWNRSDSMSWLQMSGLTNKVKDSASGIQVAGLTNAAGALAGGMQLAGLINNVGTSVEGVQMAGVSNNVKESIRGLQLAGVFNVSGGSVEGVQSAGIFNVATSSARGLQLAGIFNNSKDYVSGGQVAGIFNNATEEARGFQLAGIVNIAGSIHGSQASLVANVADEVYGTQSGLVNVGGVVKGVQFGLINLSDEMHGIPIGLVNISKDGLKDVSFWYGVNQSFNFGLQFGTSTVYSFVTTGFSENWTDFASLGAGMGIELGSEMFFVDIDLYGKTVKTGGGSAYNNLELMFTSVPDVFPALRLSGGIRLFGFLSFFAGVNIDTSLSSSGWGGSINLGRQNAELYNNDNAFSLDGGDYFKATFYPSWFIGVRI